MKRGRRGRRLMSLLLAILLAFSSAAGSVTWAAETSDETLVQESAAEEDGADEVSQSQVTDDTADADDSQSSEAAENETAESDAADSQTDAATDAAAGGESQTDNAADDCVQSSDTSYADTKDTGASLQNAAEADDSLSSSAEAQTVSDDDETADEDTDETTDETDDGETSVITLEVSDDSDSPTEITDLTAEYVLIADIGYISVTPEETGLYQFTLVDTTVSLRGFSIYDSQKSGWYSYTASDSAGTYTLTYLLNAGQMYEMEIYYSASTTGEITLTAAQIDVAADVSDLGDYTLNTQGSEICLSFTPDESDRYEFYTTGDSDTCLRLYDASWEKLKSDDDSGDDDNAYIRYEMTAGETYYILLSSAATADISFTAQQYEIPYSGSCGDDVTWSVDTQTWTLTISGTGAMTDYDDDSAPWHVDHIDKIVSIVVEEGVTTVGQNAFEDFSVLTSVSLPSTLTSIGYGSFYECTALEEIEIPDGVKKIYAWAFGYDTALKTVIFPDTLTSIAERTFYGCTALESVDLSGTGMTTIEARTFSGCSSMTDVQLPSKLKTIYGSAFYGCSSLAAIEIPDSVTSIGSSAFAGCSSMISAVLPEGISTVNTSTFSGCSLLQSITIPSSVTSIANYAFYNCSSLQSITIPSAVTSIDSYAFYGCSSLAQVTLEGEDVTFGREAFKGCSALADENGFVIVAGYLFDYIGTNLFAEIPDEAECIAAYAFDSSDVFNICVPESILQIEDYAFTSCGNLSWIIFEGDAPQLGSYICYGSRVTIYYPQDNESWTEDYIDSASTGGTVTWTSYETGTTPWWTLLQESAVEITAGSLTGAEIAASGGSVYFSYTPSETALYRIYAESARYGDASYKICMLAFDTEGQPVYDASNVYGVDEPVTLEADSTYYFEIQYYYGTRTGTVQFLTDQIETTEITVDSSETATVENAGDAVYYSLTPSESGIYRVTADSSYMNISAYDASWTLLETGDDALLLYLTGTETYYLEFFYDRDSTLGSTRTGSTVVSVETPVTSGTCGASDEDEVYWEISYDTEKGFILTISGAGNMEDYADISDTPWYAFADFVSKVIVEEGVTGIGSYAFKYMEMTEVEIADSVLSIGDYAFYFARYFSEITLNEACEIGICAFQGCYYLWYASDTGFLIINNVLFIGTSSTTVTIPDGVTRIDNEAFSDHSKITTLVLPDSLTEIGDEAFLRCTSLTTISGGENLISIGTKAFSECTSLEELSFSETSLTDIGSHAFYYCTALTSVSLPDSMESIGTCSFGGCTALLSVSIPESCSIEDTAFGNCTGLADEDGFIIVNSMLFGYCGEETLVTVPDGVTGISDCAFYNDTDLAAVFLPESVAYIGKAFYRCTNLTKVIFSGDAPQFADDTTVYTSLYAYVSGSTFYGRTLTAYYPAENETWTDEVLSGDYDGDVTWTSYEAGTQPWYADIPVSAQIVLTEDITLRQGIDSSDGYTTDEDGNTVTYDYYDLYSLDRYDCVLFASGDQILITMMDDSVHTYTYDGYRFYTESEDVLSYSWADTDQETEHWEIGGSYEAVITLYDYADLELTVTISIIANPYEGAAAAFSGTAIELSEGVDSCTSTDEDGESYQYYSFSVSDFTSGDQIILTLNDGSTETFTHNGYRFCDEDGNYAAVSLSYDQSSTHWEVGGTYYITLTLTDYGISLEIPVTIVENRYLANAIDITQSGTGTAVIDTGGEYVYFKYTASESTTYKFYSVGDYDTYAYLYDADLNQLAVDDDDGEDTNAKITYVLESGCTYYIAFRFYSSGTTGSFTVYGGRESDSLEDDTQSGDTQDVTEYDLSDAVISLSKSSYTYTGSACTPGVTVTLNGVSVSQSGNYTISYANNKNAGTATVTVTAVSGSGYTGSKSASYTISKASISGAAVTLSQTSYTYSGSANTPTPTVKLSLSGSTVTLTKTTDYTVSYSGNTNAGTGYVVVTGTGNYKDSVQTSFTILKKSVSSFTVKLSASTYTYNGKARKPTVTLYNGSQKISSSYYTISYASGRKNCGRYKVTVTGKTNYSGTASAYFIIKPKKANTPKLTSTKSKKLTVKYAKSAGSVTGYQIAYRVKGGSWKYVTTTSASKTISKLKSGKTYYVKVRAYKTISGKKYYGAWSTTKSKKVK